MRCRFRRLIYFLSLIISLGILYQIHNKTNDFSKYQSSPFITIQYKNHTYRILSSTYKYNSTGSYLNFAYFNVEQRNRVLYIDYEYDIPISSQWKSSGHLYPIQIAQFGLSHWSRLELNLKTKQNDIYSFNQIKLDKNNSCSEWFRIKKKILLQNSFIHFRISSNCSLHFSLINNNIDIIYSTIKDLERNSSIKIIIPIKAYPRQVNRYILIDIEKSIKKSLRFSNDFIQFRFCGQSNSFLHQLIIGNQTLYNQQAFYSSTKWLLNTQDLQTGCWFIHVKRSNQLRIPWCSAMAQGQAASLLVRYYSLTNNFQDLLSIRRAIQPLWLSNLTRAYFNNKYLWLEEYPFKSMNKGLFVLNGCLYALIGIIDVYTIDPQVYLFELINQIISSLNFMLPYYIHPTISNWSLYDLSHITMKTKVNSASYSYHLVHITLLQCLSQLFEKTNISTSLLFHSYVKRFQSAIFVK